MIIRHKGPEKIVYKFYDLILVEPAFYEVHKVAFEMLEDLKIVIVRPDPYITDPTKGFYLKKAGKIMEMNLFIDDRLAENEFQVVSNFAAISSFDTDPKVVLSSS